MTIVLCQRQCVFHSEGCILDKNRGPAYSFPAGEVSFLHFKKRAISIRYKIGHPILYKQLSEISDIETLTSYLRFRTELLGKSGFRKSKILSFPLVKKSTKNTRTITSPENSNILLNEIETLPEDETILQKASGFETRITVIKEDFFRRETGFLFNLN